MSVFDRIDVLERNVRMLCQAPTFPIYDTQNRLFPEDFDIVGQLVIDVNFYNLSWTDQNGSWTDGPTPDPSSVGNVPQDAVEGQIAIGSDGSLNWFIAGQWWSSSFTSSTVGNVPQDIVAGQIAIGTDQTLHWYDGTTWNTFGTAVPASVIGFGFEGGLYVPISANTDYFVEIHWITDSLIDAFINGTQVGHNTSTFPAGQDFNKFSIGWVGWDHGVSPVPDNIHMQYWDIAIGTTRDGTEIFSNSLSTIPTSPPFPDVEDSGGMTIVGGHLDFAMADADQSVVNTGDGNDHSNCWISFHISFDASFINFLSTATIGDGIFVGFIYGRDYDLTVFRVS